jgi:hypothetical protein
VGQGADLVDARVFWVFWVCGESGIMGVVLGVGEVELVGGICGRDEVRGWRGRGGDKGGV